MWPETLPEDSLKTGATLSCLLWIESVLSDLRYAIRAFRRAPWYALAVIGTLGLGLGVVGTVFTVLNTLILKPIAVRDPNSLYSFYWSARGSIHRPSTWHEFTEIRAQIPVFSDVLAYASGLATIGGRKSEVQAVSDNYFRVLGGRACLGRVISDGDDHVSVAVASNAMWRRHLGADPSVVGQKLYVSGMPVTLVGVACPDFAGIEAIQGIWTSLAMAGTLTKGPDVFGPKQPPVLNLIGRLKQGMTREKAQLGLLIYGRQVSRTWSDAVDPNQAVLHSESTLTTLSPGLLIVFTPLIVLFGLVLAVACANIANMMLARALARQHEIGVRMSLGAGRARLIRQLLTESFVLALLAAGAAFGIAVATIRIGLMMASRLRTQPTDYGDVSPDIRVLFFLVGLATVSIAAFGLLPALQATNLGSGVPVHSGAKNNRRTSRLRQSLVVAQVAISVLLLILASTAFQSMRRVTRQEPSIDARSVYSIDAAGADIPPIVAELRSEPGLELVGFAAAGWLSGLGMTSVRSTESAVHLVRYNMVSPEYFEILRIRLVRGRVFNQAETDGESSVAIINEKAAQRLWPREDAIGKTLSTVNPATAFRSESFREALIIGVVSDTLPGLDDNSNHAMVYWPISMSNKPGKVIMVRMRVKEGAVPRRLAPALARTRPDLADAVTSAAEQVNERLVPARTLRGLTACLGVVALLLTVSGVYGIVSYLVWQRRKEFAVRMALGADTSDVMWLVLRGSLKPTLLGSAIGGILALGITRVIGAVVYGMVGFDIVGFSLGIILVIVPVFGASWAPARRAMAADPAATLKYE